MEHAVESNRVYESANLSEESLKIAEFLKTSNLSEIYEFFEDCEDINRIDFVINNHYMSDIMSTILEHTKVGDAYFAVDGNNILWECMYASSEVGLKLYKITNDGYVMVEQQIANM